MKRFYHRQSIKKTAEKLNRTENSVRWKAKTLKLNHYTTDISARMLANCFNVGFYTVKRWIDNHQLPCKKNIYNNTIKYLINIDDFWIWAENNKDRINWSKYNRNSLPPDPEWVKEMIWNCSTKNKYKKYTEQEIANIKHMLHRGLTYKEIAKETGRSYNAIKLLCKDIHIKERER